MRKKVLDGFINFSGGVSPLVATKYNHTLAFLDMAIPHLAPRTITGLKTSWGSFVSLILEVDQLTHELKQGKTKLEWRHHLCRAAASALAVRVVLDQRSHLLRLRVQIAAHCPGVAVGKHGDAVELAGPAHERHGGIVRPSDSVPMRDKHAYI